MQTRTLTVTLTAALLSLLLAACSNGDVAAAAAATITAEASPTTSPTAPDDSVIAGDQAPDTTNAASSPAESRRGRNGRAPGQATDPSTSPAATTVDLSAAEIDGLVYMREEEKLARDVYLTLFDEWQLPVFESIAAAESHHTGAVQSLLDAYGIDDPVTDDTIGVFTDPDLDALYDELVAIGMQSIEDALTVGAMIEDLDISDLQDALAATDNPDIERVYSSLLRGSESHLRAFTGQLSDRGAEYEAIYLDQAEIDAILQSSNGRGRNG